MTRIRIFEWGRLEPNGGYDYAVRLYREVDLDLGRVVMAKPAETVTKAGREIRWVELVADCGGDYCAFLKTDPSEYYEKFTLTYGKGMKPFRWPGDM